MTLEEAITAGLEETLYKIKTIYAISFPDLIHLAHIYAAINEARKSIHAEEIILYLTKKQFLSLISPFSENDSQVLMDGNYVGDILGIKTYIIEDKNDT